MPETRFTLRRELYVAGHQNPQEVFGPYRLEKWLNVLILLIAFMYITSSHEFRIEVIRYTVDVFHE